MEQLVLKDIVQPTVDGMRAEGVPFQGVLFAGLMIQNGMPRLLEYNVRFGDPECQVRCQSASTSVKNPQNKLQTNDRAYAGYLISCSHLRSPFDAVKVSRRSYDGISMPLSKGF
jgi:phosphoribosylamine-glycine ligase